MSVRKHVAGMAAVAAVAVGGSKPATGLVTPVGPPSSSSSVKRLSPLHQATIVQMSFSKAKTVEEFQQAESLWNDLRPGITSYEIALNCKDYGASHDQQIAIDLVGDLLQKPVELMLDVGKLIFALAGGEKDETLEALKDTAKELAKEIGKEEGKEIGTKIVRQVFPQGATNKFREALLKYLQSKSTRSRKYFLQIITDIEGVAKAYGGLALKASGALAPSRMNPEECGISEWVEGARSQALTSVFASGPRENRLLRKP